jgi:subtilisin family serine protease
MLRGGNAASGDAMLWPEGLAPAGSLTDIATIPGLSDLWAETLGDPRICIAILDGSVDQAHPSLRGANLRWIETLASDSATRGPNAEHGTHVASIIFGRHESAVKGIAPVCRGLIAPIFTDVVRGAPVPCSQVDLARALLRALEAGANVINVSGGRFSASGTSHPILADAVRACAQSGVLVVAAAGNQGCDCLHIPGALPSVLAVGAMDVRGQPLPSSNWGALYQSQGILAPGENILGAAPGGGTTAGSGTSFATAIVSGVAALFLSVQLKRGQKPDAFAVRAALVASALGCDSESTDSCRRLLAGRLDVRGAFSILSSGERAMTDPETEPVAPVTVAEPIAPSACGCGSGASGPQLVYALGQLGYDFGTEARRDAFIQNMDEPSAGVAANPNDPVQLLNYLEKNPWEAASLNWTLNLDGTAIYAVIAQGPFASEAYQRLRRFLSEQLAEGVERISIPGTLTGKVRLLNGHVVPVIMPEIRGMCSWTTAALLEQVVGGALPNRASAREKEDRVAREQALGEFLDRVYFEMRNLGVTSKDRAMNFAGTNAFNIEKVFESAIKEKLSLDLIEVERSPVCRPESDCWDVKLLFFFPERQVQTVRKVYRFTIDVSDVVPVTVGPVRSWFVR